MSLKLHGLGKITGIDQGLSVVGVTTLHNELSVSGDVVVGGGLTVTGVLTYEDVTNVDSIGIITARSGIVGDLTGNVTGNVTGDITGNIIGSPTLSGISSSISDTAVDVFVYETSKDSDGGAWRKRTQNTTWYNETLNTATRGSRREFPAVAVIVAENDTLTIYDGDDPDLPMWMVFNAGNANGNNMIGRTNENTTCTSMLNGLLCVGRDHFGLHMINFIADRARFKENGYDTPYTLPIGTNRNGGNTWLGANVDGNDLVNDLVNDVAMTVLPNAPIDDATGLPVPTIAVATDGGVSVIKDNGTVVDIRRTSDDDVHHVDLDGNRVIMFMELGAIYVATIPGNDQSGNPNSSWTVYGSYGGNTSGTDYPAIQAYGPGLDLVSMKDHTFATAGYNQSDNRYKGLSILSENLESSGSGMVAWAHTDFNTGWMHGDIKGAFLSDTDTTNITSGEILSNGDFTNGTTGWTLQDAGEGSISVSSNQLTLNNSTSSDPPVACYQQISLEVGKYYNVISSRSTGLDVVVNITTATSNGGGTGGYGNVTYHSSNNEIGATFLATHATMYCYIRVNTNATGTAVMNFVSIRKAEEDRSINNDFSRNKASALTINGTITKSPVATGAELVAYSGFSSSNVLVQPYNSNLNPGTGNYSFMCWFKCSSTGGEQMIMRRFGVPTVTGGMMMRIVSSSSVIQWYVRDTSSTATVVNSTMALDDGNWHCAVGTREGSTAKLYIDGKLNSDSGCSVNSHDPGTTADLVIGAEESGGNPGTYQNSADVTSLALVRYSLSAPSAAQVKKMYENEKFLFQENAKCTLYGSSDAVTALDYDEDTELLHVGTSAGRSDFQGLRRINNTTTAVTTAISASDDLIAEQ